MHRNRLAKWLWLQIVVFFSCLSVFAPKVNAIYDPTSVPNNKFGIHIVSDADLQDASALVNSSGGDWGYVKFVIQDTDRDLHKWQQTFDKLREAHLIPIVRIATHPSGQNWEKPKTEEATSWAQFLNQLNWVTENRYVVIFNEPNHSKEWGGSVSPQEYVEVLKAYSRALKDENPDFFVLNAGLDASAPNSRGSTMDEADFLAAMYLADPQVFDYIDGFASHSYPNPGFSGSPTDSGKGSVGTFVWELDYLAKLGVTKKLPIFITETGWSSDNLSDDKITEYFVDTFSTVWNTPDIVCVIPFVLNYQSAPFTQFSWLRGSDPDSKYTPWYTAVQDLPKEVGSPKQLRTAQVVDELPEKLIESSSYEFTLDLVNTGQAIWDSARGDTIVVSAPGLATTTPLTDFKVLPGQHLTVPFTLKTALLSAEYALTVEIQTTSGVTAALYSANIRLISPLKLSFTVRPFLQDSVDGDNFSFLILDGKNQVLSFNDVSVTHGIGNIPEIHNIVPGRQYTFVLKNPDYFSRQDTEKVSVGANLVEFGYMFPRRLSKTYFTDFASVLRKLELPDTRLMNYFFAL